MYEYAVEVKKVVDGDTVDVRLDLGFSVGMSLRVRLLGVNTPELHDKDPKVRERAHQARAWVEGALAGADAVTAQTAKPALDDKYGRWLATIMYRPRGSKGFFNLNEGLVAAGLATRYDGTGPKT